MRTLGLVTCSLLALVACGKKDGGGSSGSSGGGGGPADPTSANAAVPATLKDKLEFVPARDDKHGLSYVTPKGWKEGAIPGMVRPPDEANLGFMTKYSVGTNCDGTCEAKDWAAVADKVEFSQLASAGKVVSDDKMEGHRMMIVDLGDRKEVAMAWWKKGADHYVSCRASLEGDAVAALAAFGAACHATRPGL